MKRTWRVRAAGMIALGVIGCSATHEVDPRVDEGDVQIPNGAVGDAGDAGVDSGPSCGPDPGSTDAGPGSTDAGANVDAGSSSDAGPADSGVFCHGRAFSLALTIPMPSNYVLAGFAAGAYEPGLVFVTNASPALALAHPISRLVAGDMSLPNYGSPKETLYKPQAKTIGIVGPEGATWLFPWRLMEGASTASSLPYYMVSGSDGPNVENRTNNLPALGPGTVLSASDGRNDESQALRNGAEVYVWSGSSNTWTRVALLGADSSGWKGLAIIQPAYGNSITGRYIFTQAKVTAGGAGIVEQYWPNALPSSAGAPTVVSPVTDAVPVGVRANGCELYAIRGTPGAFSVLVFRR
ncbi:hypothetical protein LVJ94_28185 [Pendulispora rubella]|uniref:Uncharacterized protein n=1 Tax=Pendulispora rubella TaxID=2741070 RepID=A0ABZ2KSW2_9BACT